MLGKRVLLLFSRLSILDLSTSSTKSCKILKQKRKKKQIPILSPSSFSLPVHLPVSFLCACHCHLIPCLFSFANLSNHTIYIYTVNLKSLHQFLQEEISLAQQCYQGLADAKHLLALNFKVGNHVYVKAKYFWST